MVAKGDVKLQAHFCGVVTTSTHCLEISLPIAHEVPAAALRPAIAAFLRAAEDAPKGPDVGSAAAAHVWRELLALLPDEAEAGDGGAADAEAAPPHEAATPHVGAPSPQSASRQTTTTAGHMAEELQEVVESLRVSLEGSNGPGRLGQIGGLSETLDMIGKEGAPRGARLWPPSRAAAPAGPPSRLGGSGDADAASPPEVPSLPALRHDASGGLGSADALWQLPFAGGRGPSAPRAREGSPWAAGAQLRPGSLGGGPSWSGGPLPRPERSGALRTAPGLAAATALLPEELLRGAPRTEPIARPSPRPESAWKPVPLETRPALEPRSGGSPEAALADDLRQLEEWAAKLREPAGR